MSRHPLDLTSLRDSIAALEAALNVTGDRAWLEGQPAAIRRTLIAGVIRHFEFVYELCFKMIRRRLELEEPQPAVLQRNVFRDIMRLAGDYGLIKDVEAWFRYREARNRTAHTYDEAKAMQLYAELRPFLADAKAVLAALEARNE